MLGVRLNDTCRCGVSFRRIKKGEIINFCPVCGTMAPIRKYEDLVQLSKIATKEKKTGSASIMNFGGRL